MVTLTIINTVAVDGMDRYTLRHECITDLGEAPIVNLWRYVAALKETAVPKLKNFELKMKVGNFIRLSTSITSIQSSCKDVAKIVSLQDAKVES